MYIPPIKIITIFVKVVCPRYRRIATEAYHGWIEKRKIGINVAEYQEIIFANNRRRSLFHKQYKIRLETKRKTWAMCLTTNKDGAHNRTHTNKNLYYKTHITRDDTKEVLTHFNDGSLVREKSAN